MERREVGSACDRDEARDVAEARQTMRSERFRRESNLRPRNVLLSDLLRDPAHVRHDGKLRKGHSV